MRGNCLLMRLRKTTLINAVVFSQKSVADIFSFPSLSLHIIAPTKSFLVLILRQQSCFMAVFFVSLTNTIFQQLITANDLTAVGII